MPAKQWAHGDIPAAADMQAYSDGLNALYADTPAYNSNRAIVGLDNVAGVPGSTVTFAELGCWWRVVHRQRFLHYWGEGAIVDLAGIADDVTLPATSTGYGYIDVDSIAWMVYGLAYKVTGVTACYEWTES